MARGFWKGLLHGAGISAVGLAALSLLTPLPEQDVPPAPGSDASAGNAAETLESAPKEAATAADPEVVAVKPASTVSGADVGTRPATDGSAESDDGAEPDTASRGIEAESPTESPEIGTTDIVVEPVTEEEADRPQAAAIDLPVGSEFGRGGDMLPALPTPLTPNSQFEQSEPPAVSAPAAEPAPVGATAVNLPPETAMPGSDLSQTEAPEADDGRALERPSAQSAPASIEMPGKIRASDQDSLPESSSAEAIDSQTPAEGAEMVEETDAAGQDGTESLASTADPDASESDQDSAAPVLPSPSLDLSTPPDLSDLRRLQRN